MIPSFKKINRELLLFIFAVGLIALSESILNSTLNNFLDETFSISSLDRTLLEFPRELPGFLVVFISAALFFLRSRRLAVFATLLGSMGFLLLAFFSVHFHVLFFWIFLYSAGQHLILPLISSIGMELAHTGREGHRLGQVNSVRNMATILGSFVILIGFTYCHLTFKTSFILAAILYLLAGLFFYHMTPGQSHPPKLTMKLHKEYRLYYWLAILFGIRKQLFLTFAPWVLVTIYHKPTSMIATLLFMGGLAGIFFQPLLGKMIDKRGERFVFFLESILLVWVCLGYGFAKDLLSFPVAFGVISVCFIVDQLLISVNMARATYLKKIVQQPEHITPTLTMAVTLDHFFSILVAIAGGILWTWFGFQVVFLFGACIAVLNFISVWFVRIPQKTST